MRDAMNTSDFWSPEFTEQHRDDGTILMRQKGELPAYLPTLADYLDKWANEAPERTWIARRNSAGGWDKISYGEALIKAKAIGGALLAMGLGPKRPLVILSENSLEHALLGAACFYTGIPYSPLSPAYSLVSKDHGKLKDIAATLEPGALYADDGEAFAPAFASIAAEGRGEITRHNQSDGAISFESLLSGNPALAEAARATLTGEMVVKYLFTSGSTGAPKAVINTNTMICAMEAMVRDCYRFLEKSPPIVLDWAP